MIHRLTKPRVLRAISGILFWALFGCAAQAQAQVQTQVQTLAQVQTAIQTQGSQSDRPRQKVGLVLSGGGAKGVAHVGVIKALEENGIPIDYVAGTSMGAIVAGLYAIGYTPDEMLELFLSEAFELWSKGDVEEQYGYYAYRMDPRPDMFWLRFDTKPGTGSKPATGIKPVIRPNLVSSFPMDLAFLHYFAGATAKSGGDFNKLFVPFRSVASDIADNKAFISRKGDLGSAIRASMTFPVYFRPITIDSTVLFDGGLVNNFPWDIMDQDFHPDIIIGSKCVGNAKPVDENDILTLLERMVMFSTNYDIPAEKGIVISTLFEGVNLLDFPKSKELALDGYNQTMEMMDSIKTRITSRRTLPEVTLLRQNYRASLPPIIFKDISISGNLNDKQKSFLARMVPKSHESIFTYDEMKGPYYKMVGTGNVKHFYPLAQFDSTSHKFTLNLDATRAARFRLSLGGNISSASANQGYVGFEYHGWGKVLTRTVADMSFGRLYTSTRFGIRQDYPDKANLFYEAYGTFSRYDYYRSNADLFFEDVNLTYMKQYDSHLRVNLGWPVKRNNALVLGVAAGFQQSEYYQQPTYTPALVPERSGLHYVTYYAQFKKNSLNFKQYANLGRFRLFQLLFLSGNVQQRNGSEPAPGVNQGKKPLHRFQFLYRERKFKTLSPKWSVGLHIEATFTEQHKFDDYYSMIASLPAFRPTPHSESMFMESFRAETWLGAGITPIYRLGEKTSLQTGWFIMQPYKDIRQGPDKQALYGCPWHKTNIAGFGGFVWQSPIGPLSLMINYYNSEQKHWYYQLNLGYILFNRKGIE